MNSGKEIARNKMTLHSAYCSKNIKKCELCSEPIEIAMLQEHIVIAQGNFKVILEAIEEADIDDLQLIDKHLSNSNINEKFLENEEKENPLKNSVIHFIISHCKKNI